MGKIKMQRRSDNKCESLREMPYKSVYIRFSVLSGGFRYCFYSYHSGPCCKLFSKTMSGPWQMILFREILPSFINSTLCDGCVNHTREVLYSFLYVVYPVWNFNTGSTVLIIYLASWCMSTTFNFVTRLLCVFDF